MLDVRFSNAIQKDFKLLVKRGCDMTKFANVVKLLVQDNNIPAQFKDHPLKGNWTGFRECHISPDWLLIYEIDDKQQTLTLARTGTHSDLFKS